MFDLFGRLHIRVEFVNDEFFLYLFDNFDIVGSVAGVEVSYRLRDRLLRKRFMPTDYEKVMKTVKRSLVSKKLPKASALSSK